MKALVTGAAGGIGSAIADSLTAHGHDAYRHDVRPSEHMDVVGDLLDDGARSRVAEFVESAGLDCVVAAHGLPGSIDLRHADADFIDRVMLVNTVAVMRLYDDVSAILAERQGAFVIVSSQAGLVGEAQNGVYSASKFALVGWARELARDSSTIRPRIRVICPGMTETPLLVGAFQGMADATDCTYDEVLNSRLAQVPGGRLGQPSEIGRATVWLAELQKRDCLVAVINGGELLV